MRWSLRGLTEEGDEAWLIRGISRKLYRCPGCHGEIEIGGEHTIVQYVHRLGGTEHHHWHRRCAEELLVPELRQPEAGARRRSRAQSKLEARGTLRPGRRRALRCGVRGRLSIYAGSGAPTAAGHVAAAARRRSSSCRSG